MNEVGTVSQTQARGNEDLVGYALKIQQQQLPTMPI